MRKYLRLTLCSAIFLLFHVYLHGQGIRGSIRTAGGEPLPDASIFIKEDNTGSSSNANGEYSIKLKPGTYTVIVRYLGYKTEQLQVQVSGNWIEKDFSLAEQRFSLDEVQVDNKDKNKDPAYAIMRKAIAKRKYHLLQYDSYEMKVYIKGTGELTKAPFFLRQKLKKEGVKLNEAYTLESVSLIKYRQVNKVDEKVISVRTTGENTSGAHPGMFLTRSFYNENLASIVSPLSKAAFSYYRFKFKGSFFEGKHEINRIRVTPKSKGDNVFEGMLYIIDGLWAIHSLNLKASVMGFPITAVQNYAEVAPNVWLPVTHRYTFERSVFGFAGHFKYLATCRDYKVVLNKDLAQPIEIVDEKTEPVVKEVPERISSKNVAKVLASEDKIRRKQFVKMMEKYEEESIKKQKEPAVVSEENFSIDSLAGKRSEAYWDSIRPVPLTEKEERGYRRDDSLARIESAKLSGKDTSSIIKKSKFQPQDVLFGANYRFSPKTSFKLKPPIANVYFNAVEGFNINLSGDLKFKYDSLKRSFDLSPTIRYGFSSDRLYGKLNVTHRYGDQGKARYFYFEAGNFVQQYNVDRPIHPHVNTLGSLFLKQNDMKIFEKRYAATGLGISFSPFFQINADVELARRNELFNGSNFSFLYHPKEYEPNRPLNIETDAAFPQNDATTLNIEISYRPFETYKVRNGRKIPVLEKSPQLLGRYRKGISGVFGSDVDFDFLEAGVNHSLDLGGGKRLEFQVAGGKFFNNRKTYFPDYKHFDGNRTSLSGLRPATSFRILDYYLYSTNDNYYSANTYFQFRKFLLTRIPEVRFTGVKESLFVNYLKTARSPHYYELGYSLDNVLVIFRVEAAFSFIDQYRRDFGVRVGVATMFKIDTD